MSSESIIYHSDDLLCRLHIDGPMETTKSGPLFIFRILSGSQLSILKIDSEINNQESCWFWWPNQEGERGLLSDIHSKLDHLDKISGNGISVIYPVSASCRTIILGDEKGGIILSAMPDEKGRISQIGVKSKTGSRVEFTVKTGRSCWLLTQYHGGPDDALDWIRRIIEKVKWPALPEAEPASKYLLQLGLIGPDYDCLVPEEEGFMVMEEVARTMKKRLGKGNWLHVFGYSHGHDILYPDYKPSSFLGGEDRLQEAISAVHKQGQKVSFYLNLRLSDQSLVENDFALQRSTFKDHMGRVVTEKAHDRTFYIMNPDCQDWQDRIVKEAKRLIDLGADGLELNYRGRQALLVPLGEQWGQGIRTIITRIKELGCKVWFRGATDIYPADWLEMSREEVIIESDGHIFSGNAIGEADPRLFQTLVPGCSFMLPLSRKPLPMTEGTVLMRDLENIMGGLFIYDEEYLERIDMIMKRTAEQDVEDESNSED